MEVDHEYDQSIQKVLFLFTLGLAFLSDTFIQAEEGKARTILSADTFSGSFIKDDNSNQQTEKPRLVAEAPELGADNPAYHAEEEDAWVVANKT